MFVDHTLASRLEAAEARLTLAAATAIGRRRSSARCVRLGSAVAFASGEGSPFDKIIGLGFGPFDGAALLAFEDETLRAGGSLRAELSTLADAEVARAMTERGYRLQGFENVSLCEPARAERAERVPDLEVRLARTDEIPLWITTLTSGFLHPDDGSAPSEDFGRAALEQVFADMASNGSFHPVLAFHRGAVAGGAGLGIDVDALAPGSSLAQLCGASTLPAFRRRGVQGQLLRFRLEHAAAAGCALATVTTEPGSRSQANVLRAGFTLAYARSVLTRGP